MNNICCGNENTNFYIDGQKSAVVDFQKTELSRNKIFGGNYIGINLYIFAEIRILVGSISLVTNSFYCKLGFSYFIYKV